jgi:type IV pilus assembly protein PilA
MKKQTGFTLIELLLVLAIIGIIAAIAIPALLGQRERAKAKAVGSLVVNVAGEAARISDTLKENSATPSTVTASIVAAAITGMSNYAYPAAKNPYGGTTTPYVVAAGVPTTLGVVNLEATDTYNDSATGQTYPAVILRGLFKDGTSNGTVIKVVALD